MDCCCASLKLSIRVSEASYEPICLRQVNPVTGIKCCLVKDCGTQSNFHFQSKNTVSKAMKSEILTRDPVNCNTRMRWLAFLYSRLHLQIQGYRALSTAATSSESTPSSHHKSGRGSLQAGQARPHSGQHPRHTASQQAPCKPHLLQWYRRRGDQASGWPSPEPSPLILGQCRCSGELYLRLPYANSTSLKTQVRIKTTRKQ